MIRNFVFHQEVDDHTDLKTLQLGQVSVRFVERLPDGRVIVQPPLDDRGLLTFIVARGAAGGIELLELPAGSPRLAA